MKKRILSAVVVLVLFAGVLAGCISGHGTQEAKLNITVITMKFLSAPFMTVMGTAWGI